MLLKVAIKYYCVKNKGEIIYEENSIKRSKRNQWNKESFQNNG